MFGRQLLRNCTRKTTRRKTAGQIRDSEQAWCTAPRAYSQGWRAGNFLFVTGTGPIDPAGDLVGDTIEQHTEQTIENISAILQADGFPWRRGEGQRTP
jgi:enamine deaminase RidA (YjgF/YER057c/UK114 family)